MGIFDFFNRSKKASKSAQPGMGNGVVFIDSMGRVIGNGNEGYKMLTSGEQKPTFYEISNDAFGRSPWVYIVVDRIAKGCLKVWGKSELVNMEGDPISSQQRRIQRVRELESLLLNPQQQFNNQSFDKIVYTVISNYLLTGNGYLMGMPYGTDEAVRYTDLIAPLTQNVQPNDNGFAKLVYYNINYYGLSFMPPAKDVMQMSLPNLTYDQFEGHSAMQSLVNIWKANNAVNSNEQFIHERKGANGIIYSDGARPMTPKERRSFQGQVDRDVNDISRVGRYTYYPQKVGYIDLTKSFKELQAHESKDSHRGTIAAAYNYPVQLLNDTRSTTDNNMAAAHKNAFANAILPVYDFFLKEFNKWLIVDNYNVNTVKVGYKVESIPEMNSINTEKTDDQGKKIDMVLKVNKAVSDGEMTTEAGVNTLVTAGGFSEDEARELVTVVVIDVQGE